MSGGTALSSVKTISLPSMGAGQAEKSDARYRSGMKSTTFFCCLQYENLTKMLGVSFPPRPQN